MTTTNPAPGERVSVHDVLRAANKLAGVDLTRRFSGEHKEARFKHAAFLAARHLTGASYSIIARVFGGMDHTSVLHGVKHCKRGHPLSGDNLFRTTAGSRGCKQCRRLHKLTYRARQNG